MQDDVRTKFEMIVTQFQNAALAQLESIKRVVKDILDKATDPKKVSAAQKKMEKIFTTGQKEITKVVQQSLKLVQKKGDPESIRKNLELALTTVKDQTDHIVVKTKREVLEALEGLTVDEDLDNLGVCIEAAERNISQEFAKVQTNALNFVEKKAGQMF